MTNTIPESILLKDPAGGQAECRISAPAQGQTEILLYTEAFHLSRRLNRTVTREEVAAGAGHFLSFRNDGRMTELLIQRNLQISTMESCTCGLIASNLTDCEGASAILKGAYITYSNQAKVMAGVSEAVIERFGVYSPETAAQMAQAARAAFASDIGIGITGSFSNPDPANPDSVAGEVYYQILTAPADSAFPEYPVKLVFHHLDVTRKMIKQKTVDIVLATLYATLMSGPA